MRQLGGKWPHSLCGAHSEGQEGYRETALPGLGKQQWPLTEGRWGWEWKDNWKKLETGRGLGEGMLKEGMPQRLCVFISGPLWQLLSFPLLP